MRFTIIIALNIFMIGAALLGVVSSLHIAWQLPAGQAALSDVFSAGRYAVYLVLLYRLKTRLLDQWASDVEDD